MIMGEGVALAATGLAIGTAASMALARMVESFLYNVKANDAVTLVSAAATLLAAALAATFAPARKASRIDPIVALRAE